MIYEALQLHSGYRVSKNDRIIDFSEQDYEYVFYLSNLLTLSLRAVKKHAFEVTMGASGKRQVFKTKYKSK